MGLYLSIYFILVVSVLYDCNQMYMYLNDYKYLFHIFTTYIVFDEFAILVRSGYKYTETILIPTARARA